MGSDPVFILFVILALFVVGFVILKQLKPAKKEAPDPEPEERKETENKPLEQRDEDVFETIRTYSYIHDVSVMRARLEAEGIETFVTNEQALSANPLATALGGVELKVRKSEVMKALQIIEEDEEIRGWQDDDEELEDQ